MNNAVKMVYFLINKELHETFVVEAKVSWSLGNHS